MIGQTLGNYRVLEKIGAGGIGIVYKAHDEKLDREVALKVLAAGTPADEITRRRFRKEALALSQLNHPNIATVYDFESREGVDWLVMELVTGGTLSQKLAGGALAEPEILDIGIQIAGALEEAHERGVIHRDLKASNIMISSKGLVKILDFGLAILIPAGADPNRTRGLSEIVTVAGTPPYMSPEQLLGEPLDARSDLYSLGVVLYELAAGRMPFVEVNDARLVDAILHSVPTAPQELNPSISSGLQEVILKLLQKKPELRYQSAQALAAGLRRLSSGSRVEETPRRSRRWRWAALAAVVILSVLLALAGRQLWVQRRENETPKQTEQQPVPVPHRRSVAVLGFKNISGHPDSNWLSTAFSELLTTELAAGGHLRAIPGENIARMKSDLSLPDADSFGGDTLVRIRNNLGADLVVLGSYLAVGDSQKQIRLDLRLQDASTGQMLAMMSEKGTEAQVLDLISRAGAVLRQELGFGELLAGEKMELKTSLPSNREALRFYSEGLLKLRLFDAHGARQLMEKALSLEPNYALAQAALAAAWSTLGYDAKATQAARRAVDLSARLPREQRLLIEGRYRVITREWPKAVEIYRSLFDFFRDNLDYGLHLATTQSSSGDGKGALATIDLLRKLPEPAQHDPRIDLAESLAAGTLSDFGRSQEAAARAVASGELKGARSLVAQGCLLQGQAYWKLGTLALATQSFERAQKLYAAAGDRWGVANAVLNQGVILSDQGDLSAARQSFAKALATYRQIGNHKGIASVLASTAILLRRQADLVGAMQNYREALKIYREIGDHANAAVTLNNLANLHGELGQVADARKVYEEALSIFRELGNRNAAGTVLGNLGDLLAEEGDPKKAKLHYQDSLEIFQQIGNRSSAASMLAHLGDLMALEGDLQTARGKHEEALNIRKGLGERGSVAESQASLARLAVPEKRFTDAEALCRAALEEFRREGRTDDEAAARTVLARSLLGQGKSVESQNEINHAAYLAKSSQNRSVQITVSLASASIHAALGRSGEAVKTLEEALVEARKSGLTSLQFEARLALGETEIAGGRPEAGRLRLAALEKEATALGYRFIAQKAAAANR